MQELSALQYVQNHRPTPWSRSTVADGHWFQTYNLFNNNDEKLGVFIDDLVIGLNTEEKTRASADKAILNVAMSYTDKTLADGISAYIKGSAAGLSSAFSSYFSEINTWKSDINAWSADINGWQTDINVWQNETVNPKLNELESAIAGIEGASDVYDIVDTSAALNNYTGRLTPKAVIKVLSAGPNNDQQVYYRWNHDKTETGTWTIADFDYIGAVQAYYDKGYIDSNYYKKTETYTKTEVDNNLNGKGAANWQGTATVEQINEMTTQKQNDAWNIAGSGTIVNPDGSEVKCTDGDGVIWNGSKWVLFIDINIQSISEDFINNLS